MVEILNVKSRKDKVKYLIIPKKSIIQSGDKVLVTNDLELINKFIEGEEKSQKKKQISQSNQRSQNKDLKS